MFDQFTSTLFVLFYFIFRAIGHFVYDTRSFASVDLFRKLTNASVHYGHDRKEPKGIFTRIVEQEMGELITAIPWKYNSNTVSYYVNVTPILSFAFYLSAVLLLTTYYFIDNLIYN